MLATAENRSVRRIAGFSVVELIIVLFIMALLTVLAVPMLSTFMKTSKVQQACASVSAVLYRARMESLRSRRHVGVFFGDDLSKLPVQPTAGILPQKGRIEAWFVKTGYNVDNTSSGVEPYNNQGDWYPYKDPESNLTPDPVVLPDGIRVLAGLFQRSGGSPPIIDYGWNNPDPSNPVYKMTPDGEIKRHEVVFSRTGAAPGWYDGLNVYQTLLVFDEATGEHAIIAVEESVLSSKPRVLSFQLHGVYGPSGTFYLLKTRTDLATNMDK